MKIEIDTVKGFQDFLPPESLKRRKVKSIVEKYFRLYGFLPVETPVIEFEELMKSDALPTEQEDEAISDRFRLKDRAGRNLGLRYEFTFQLARILRQNPNMKLPFRKYQIGENFRDEPIGAGRFRQFTQCDIDIIGDESIDSEVDCLAAFKDILNELKIDSEFQINNRALLSAIIESVEIKQVKQVMKELDKLDKIGEDNVKLNLKKYADTNQVLTLFKLLEKDIQFFKENAFDGAQSIFNLIEKCKKYNIPIKFNPTMIRGFSYYTGNIFEIKVPGKSSIAGGGRYDNLVGKYIDRKIPAVGISFGLERITELAQIDFSNEQTKAILISLKQEEETINLANKLRAEGISCITSNDKVGKSLEYANSYQIPFAIFIGEIEVVQKKFKLKNMISGEEQLLTEKQIIKELSK